MLPIHIRHREHLDGEPRAPHRCHGVGRLGLERGALSADLDPGVAGEHAQGLRREELHDRIGLEAESHLLGVILDTGDAVLAGPHAIAKRQLDLARDLLPLGAGERHDLDYA
jgi:hypothetical protein